jgi:endonuclease YncB( thermonuclease family)
LLIHSIVFFKKKLNNMKKFNGNLVILLILVSSVIADEISGVPSITDGDTVKILNKRVRFHGIDAPEKKQICFKNFKEYNCGKESTDALAKKIDGKSILCKAQDRLDRYNRYIGVCFLKELNLNKWMVRNGYAVAYRRYSKDYIEDEKYAKKNKLGLWSGNFISPDKWRKLN